MCDGFWTISAGAKNYTEVSSAMPDREPETTLEAAQRVRDLWIQLWIDIFCMCPVTRWVLRKLGVRLEEVC